MRVELSTGSRGFSAGFPRHMLNVFMSVFISLLSDAPRAFAAFRRTFQDTPVKSRRVSRHWCIFQVPGAVWQLHRTVHLARLHETIGNSAEGTFATLESASLLYDLPVLVDDVHVQLGFVAPHQRRKTLIGAFLPGFAVSTVSRHRRNKLPGAAFAVVNGIPTLTPEYLLLEYLALPDVERAFVGAEAVFRWLCGADRRARKQVNKRANRLRKRLRALVRQGDFPYARRRVLRRLPFIGPWSESVAESRAKALFLLHGFPVAEQQVPVCVEGRVFYPDFLWRKQGIFVEIDGDIKYAGEDADRVRSAELAREDALLRVFARVVRFRWDDLSEGGGFERLRSLFPPGVVNPRRVL